MIRTRKRNQRMVLCLVRGYEHVLIAGEEQSDNQNKLREEVSYLKIWDHLTILFFNYI